MQIMKGIYLIFFFFILISCNRKNEIVTTKINIDATKEISFYTRDNIRVFGDLYTVNKDEATILLFHQGGSNSRGEYNEIIPLLIEKGYNVLAIDQRQGGQTYGSYNRTIANIPDQNYSYCDAYPDLEGALDFLISKAYSGKKILWGSSYSAALVIKLADKRPDDIAAVLSFSPASGGPMKSCRAREYFETLKVPLLILRPGSEMEIESVVQQAELAKQFNHEVYVAENGIHGSSMLVDSRVKRSVLPHWKVVLNFLDRHR